tara:strand:- start:5955 stop:6155 length:201 start_codon:yes stop_codon:yes gene_type:complete
MIDNIIKVTTKESKEGVLTKLTLFKYFGIALTFVDGQDDGKHLGIGFVLFFLELEFVIRLWNTNAA